MSFLGPTALDVVEVTGRDRLDYLEAVTTQHVVDLSPGEVRGAMHLDAHGAPVAVFEIVAEEERSLLLVPRPLTETVIEVLGGRTFLSDARFRRLDDAEVRAIRGDGVADLVAAQGLAAEPGTARSAAAVLVVGRTNGVDLVGDPAALDEVAAVLAGAGVAEGTAAEVRAADVAAGVPAWDSEIRPPHLPEELGLLSSHVHLAKGCYPGQEAVARMWMLGRPRRALAAVEVDEGVAPGWVTGAGKRRVEVTSVAAGLGLAFVPADATAGESFVGDDGATVRVRTLVGAGSEVPGHDPAMTRRRDRRTGRTSPNDE